MNKLGLIHVSAKRAYLSLGSNWGSREEYLARALEELASAGISVVARSSLYETEPQGMAAQPWFLNMAVGCETHLFPLQLMITLLGIERSLGRRRSKPRSGKVSGPRLIDLDLLLFEDVVMETPQLTLPHPRMLDRRFVLEPLIEIAPDLRHPVTKKLLRDYLPQVRGQRMELMPRLSQ